MDAQEPPPGNDLDRLATFVRRLTFAERKALITLARSQSIPTHLDSPILFAKVSPILDKLTTNPPFLSLSSDTLSEDGYVVLRLLTSPLTTGLLIVYALGVELTDEQVEEGKLASFKKELEATQTRRREGTWNWPAILNPLEHRGEIIHPQFPDLSPLQQTFHRALPHFRQSVRGRIILPHYSSRGISSQSARWLLSRIDKRRPKYGSARTFHSRLDRRNVTSRDVVHHFIRHGEWAKGLTEMKQKWYPSGLLPRTYFSWSGSDIAVSGYLRNFFNDLADVFECTDRHNRVQPGWLSSRHPHHQGFSFYDLTSFTSWFHEQVPFLRAQADLFRNTVVYLVGENLTLSEHDLGSLIDGYTDKTTDFARFVVNGSLCGLDYSEREFTHLCAGFLGIPGNLVTCTLAHGLALASLQSDSHSLQVPGDDVGFAFTSREHERDSLVCASTLGRLQFDKVFHLPEICIYLKRLVIDLGSRIDLAFMLIFPLLPYLINPDHRKRSNQFTLPERDQLHRRAAHVMVAFLRDLWKHTKGSIDSESEGIILLFLRRIHQQVGLPQGAIFQGRLCETEAEAEVFYPNLPVKFPVDDDRCLQWNPDQHFASKHVHRMTIRDTTDVRVNQFQSLHAGEILIVNNRKGWRFLEDMGYIRILGIPGEKLELIGADARNAFLFAAEPSLRRVEVVSDLSTSQLVAADVLRTPESVSFADLDGSPGLSDPNLRSWRYRRYVDLDDVGSAGIFGRSKDWVDNELQSTRASLSPEPFMDLDY